MGDVIGLHTAIQYINSIGLPVIADREQRLLQYATEQLSQIDGLQIVGTAPEKSAIISFNVNGIHPFDIGTLIDQMGVAVRTGHHCSMPIMEHFGIPGTLRASFAFYNTEEEVDRLVAAVKKAVMMLG